MKLTSTMGWQAALIAAIAYAQGADAIDTQFFIVLGLLLVMVGLTWYAGKRKPDGTKIPPAADRAS